MNEKMLPLYEATRETANTFWEWRHKVMTRFFVVTGSTFLASAWLYNNEELRRFCWVPFVLGSVFALISYSLDGVNTWILRETYRRAGELERELFTPDGGIFSAIDVLHYKKGSYARIMQVVYLASALGFMILAVSAAILSAPKEELQQSGPANGSQPFISGTTRTSSAAGSRR